MRNTNKYDKPGVIVIGGHVQGLGITRIYGKNRIPVILLDTTQLNLTKHSKYCLEFIHYKEGLLYKNLISLGKNNRFKNWLLMPTNDKIVGELGQNKEELSKYFKVSTENSEILKYFFNKRLTYKLALSLNIQIPKTWIADTWDELKDFDIDYPCIIKPAIMHTFYSQTKQKVFVCKTRNELKKNYKRALTIIPENEIIVQDIIPGNSEHQYSACFMFDGNKPLVTLIARRARQHPPDFGNATTYAETVQIPELVKNASKLLRESKFTGVCEVEFKYDTRDKIYKFLEVNPRTWKWHSIAEKSNSPILMSLYNFTYGLGNIVKNTQDEATFRHLITDIPTMVKMKIQNISYVKTKSNTKYAVWDFDDLKPAIFEIIYLPYLFVTRS